MLYSWPTTSDGRVNRPCASVMTFGAKQSEIDDLPLLVEVDAPAPIELWFAAGLPFSSRSRPVAVAVGATGMTTSGSSGADLDDRPERAVGALGAEDQSGRGTVRPGTAPRRRCRWGTGAVDVGGGDLDLRPGDPLLRAPARTTRPESGPFSGRGIRKSRTNSASSLMVIFSSFVRGGPMRV